MISAARFFIFCSISLIATKRMQPICDGESSNLRATNASNSAVNKAPENPNHHTCWLELFILIINSYGEGERERIPLKLENQGNKWK